MRDAPAGVCATRITYGDGWVRPADHGEPFDIVDGLVTWDGACSDEAGSSFAVLSNGFKPYFTGASGCAIALDHAPGCGQPAACTTRVTYGATWQKPADHPAQFDDIAGRVFWDGACRAAGTHSSGELSGDGRMVLVDRIVWRDGWPRLPGAPSSLTRPLP